MTGEKRTPVFIGRLTDLTVFPTIGIMRVFITGGTGFIGSHLVDSLLLENDIEIYALVRDLHNKKWLEGRDIRCLEGDLNSLPPLPENLDYVYHLAGLTKALKSEDYYTVNQADTASFFKTLVSRGIRPRRLVLLSSLAAAGPAPPDRPSNETDLPHPINPYGRSKLLGEQEALRLKDHLPVTVIRVGAVFGPRDRDFLAYFRWISRGISPTFGPQPQKLTFCYVKDLVKALKGIRQADLESGEILNIGDPTPYTWDTFGRTAGRLLGKTPRNVRFPWIFVYLVALLNEARGKLTGRPNILDRDKIREGRYAWVADIKRAGDTLGFRPDYSLLEALEETIAWYREKEWI